MGDVVKKFIKGPPSGKDYEVPAQGFSKAESHPQKFRKAHGSVKDVGAAMNADTTQTSMNIPQEFQEAARSAAAGEQD